MPKVLSISILVFWAVSYTWFAVILFKLAANLFRLMAYVKKNSPQTISRYFFRFRVFPRPFKFVDYIYGDGGGDYPVVARYKSGFRRWMRYLIWTAIAFAAVHLVLYYVIIKFYR